MKPNQKSIHPSVEFSVPELYEYTIPPLKGKCSDCNHPSNKQRCEKGVSTYLRENRSTNR